MWACAGEEIVGELGGIKGVDRTTGITVAEDVGRIQGGNVFKCEGVLLIHCWMGRIGSIQVGGDGGCTVPEARFKSVDGVRQARALLCEQPKRMIAGEDGGDDSIFLPKILGIGCRPHVCGELPQGVHQKAVTEGGGEHGEGVGRGGFHFPISGA